MVRPFLCSITQLKFYKKCVKHALNWSKIVNMSWPYLSIKICLQACSVYIPLLIRLVMVHHVLRGIHLSNTIFPKWNLYWLALPLNWLSSKKRKTFFFLSIVHSMIQGIVQSAATSRIANVGVKYRGLAHFMSADWLMWMIFGMPSTVSAN